jgi:hypothetical protein
MSLLVVLIVKSVFGLSPLEQYTMLKKLKGKKPEMEIFHLIYVLFSLSHNNKYIKTIIENSLFTPLIEIHSLTMEIRYRSVQKRPSRWYAADIKDSFKNMCAWLGTFKTTEEVDHFMRECLFVICMSGFFSSIMWNIWRSLWRSRPCLWPKGNLA